jgi:hypothetical protein
MGIIENYTLEKGVILLISTCAYVRRYDMTCHVLSGIDALLNIFITCSAW